MATLAIMFDGTILNHVEQPTPTITKIGEVRSITHQDAGAPVANVTHSESTHQEKLLGLPDRGQYSIGLNHLPEDAGHQILLDARRNRTIEEFEIIYPAPISLKETIKGYVLNYSKQSAADSIWSATIDILLTEMDDTV